MRRLFLTLAIFAYFQAANCIRPTKPNVYATDINETIRELKLLHGIIRIETTNFDSLAYRKGTKAAGLLQLTPIAVKEANRLTGKKYKLKDRFNVKKSIEIFHILQTKKNPKANIKKGAFLWVSGHTSSKNSYANYYVKTVLKHVQ